MTNDPQAEFAQRIAKILNDGVMQDAVAAGLEDQGQFRLDVLDLLDALENANLKLAPDPGGEVRHANTALTDSRRNQPPR
jgi:hypothetical protein